MEHTQIVTAMELEQYADRRESEAVLPELIWLLINESVIDLIACRIPYGDAVNQPGWDGLLETPVGFRQFVPSYKSYWEIGTGSHPQNKATTDFKKRTKSMSAPERSVATYVFVTPRGASAGGWSEPAQTRWKQKRNKFGWNQIKILDSQQIADWLRDFPALGRWLLKKLGNLKSSSGLATPAEHWENLCELATGGDTSLFHKIFLVGRVQACEQLQRLFRGEIPQLLLAVESPQDAEDFVAAFLESLDDHKQRLFANKCLFVSDTDAWESFAKLKIPHVLVANPKLGIESEDQMLVVARKNGHRIIIPVSGTWAHGNDSLIQLRSPSANVLENTLRECGFDATRARELAGAGALSLAALKRYLLGLGSLPPYATWENARVLAQSGLLGKWNGTNPEDRQALEIMLGKPYGEWIEVARHETLRPDTPLIQQNDKWKLICRGEAWGALGPRITNDDLSHFEKVALIVLGEKDPKFDMPLDKQYLAAIQGKALSYSSNLREGLAESLALLGSRPGALTSCTPGKPESVANVIVRKLLLKADWVTWASLNSLLPLLAEAAPDEFLNTVEAALDASSESPFIGVFAQESSGFGGWNYTSGLLWALENLAWHPDYLVRVTTLLGGLATIDPGGNWANRPINSLNHIFLPWHPQTAASIPLRKSAIEALLREYPEVGWKTLINLLPSTHSTTSGSHRPSWRQLIPTDWKEGATNREYWEQVSSYADLATIIAATNLTKLAEIVERLPDLPEPAHLRILDHLGSEMVTSLPEVDRVAIWESLVDLAAKHRKFFDTQWAMPSNVVDRVESVAAKLAPRSSTLLYRRLFSERDIDLYEEKGSYEEQRRLLESRRQKAITEILADKSLNGVLMFSQQIESPRKAGFALGSLDSADVDIGLLPEYLGSSDPAITSFISSFVLGRYWSQKLVWVDSQLEKPWSIEQKLDLLTFLPFEPETWRRAEGLLGDQVARYWSNASVNPWGLDVEPLIEAAKWLVSCGRAHAAIDCFYLLSHKKAKFPVEFAIRALTDSLTATSEVNRLDQHHIQEIISWLQELMPADSDELFQVEWAYLPLLDPRFGGNGPKTIERRLATNPSLFCETIAAIFRPENKEGVQLETTESQKAIAHNAYRLLSEWRRLPGLADDGYFNGDEFAHWLSEVKRISTETGHLKIAMSQFGQILPNAPVDPDGLWINKSIAEALNAKDGTELRDGFRTGLFNLRGVFSPSGGEEERKISAGYRVKADALVQYGFHRLADLIRGLADDYLRQADQEAIRDPFND